MPTTPSFSQIDLWRNVLQVSRTHGTSSAQYLTSKGKLANDASKAATIKQLALLVLSQTGLEGYDPSKVVHVNRSFIHMVKEKFTPYTSDVFKYVIDSAFIGQVFSPKLKLVLGYSQWMTLKCGQDMFISIVKSMKTLESQIHELSLTVAPQIRDYFLTEDAGVHATTLEYLFALKPKTFLGERFYKKLEAIGTEPRITFTEKVPEGEEQILYSITKVIAFSTPEFISKLSSIYPDDKASLDEIHLFAKNLNNFFTLFFLRKQLESLTKEMAKHIGHYKVTLLKPIVDGSAASNHLCRSEFSCKHSYSIKMFEAIDDWEKATALQKESPTYNDYACTPEIDLHPFKELIETYEREEKFQFHESIDTFCELVSQLRHELIREAPSPQVLTALRASSCFESSISRYLEHSVIEINPAIPTSKAAWQKQMESMQSQIDKIGTYEFLKESKSFQKAFLNELKKEKAPTVVIHPDLSRISLVIEEIDEEGSVVSAEEEITQLESLLEKKPVGLSQLHSLIAKKPLHFEYAMRVTQWFDDLAGALSQEEYRDLPLHVQNYKVKIHAFSSIVDQFVNSDYSLKKVWTNPETGKANDLFIVPGILEFERKSIKGLFEYCIDSDTGVCYHRVFRKIRDDERLSDYFVKRVDFEADFPTLGSAFKSTKTKLTDSELDITFEVESIGRISFFDAETSDKITLYKVK